MKKSLDERIDMGILRWFGHVERDRIAKRVYVGEWVGSDTVKECLKKRGLGIRQARRMGWGFERRNAWGVARGMNP